MAKKKTQIIETAETTAKELVDFCKEHGFREIWHMYPFNVPVKGDDGNTYAWQPSFYSNYAPGCYPDNQRGTMPRPPQNEIDLVTSIGGDLASKDAAANVMAFLRQRCNVDNVQFMRWADIVAAIAEHQKAKPGEYSKPLGLKDWAAVFDVGRNKMREMINGGEYGFVKVGGENGRKWKLLKVDIPAEYLEKYRIQTGR